MQLFKSRDVASIESLYQRYGRHVYSLCLLLLDDASAAEETTATAFLKVARLLHQRPTPTNVEKLLVGITVGIVRGRAKEIAPQSPVSGEAGGEREEARSQGCLDPETITRPALEAAIRKLPPYLRIAFVLHEVGRLSHDEIAVMLGWTVSFSKATLAKARLELRGLLSAAQARSFLADPQQRNQRKAG
jgi:RNA polymerase sigma-70 factor (ECF subfamily)